MSLDFLDAEKTFAGRPRGNLSAVGPAHWPAMTATSGGRKLYRRVVFSNLNTSSANVRFSLNPSPGRHGRRALELLAASRDGATDAILVAHGFSIEQIVDLVRAGLATAKAERTVAGGKTIEVARARITQEGRWAL